MNIIRYLLAETVYRAVPFVPFNPIRKRLLRLCGLKIPDKSKILWGCHFYNLVVNGFKNLQLGEGVYIAEGAFFDLTAPVILKDRVVFGFQVKVLTHADPVNSYFQDKYPRRVAPVIIEEDVWICSEVTILAGVRIGRGSVIAAGSVVTKNIPAGTMAAGVPAKVRKHIEGDIN